MPSHKLAAIMFTDIVGYTQLMQKDEEKALTLLTRFKNYLHREVDGHEGEIIQYYGDGCLAIFQSSFHATQCAQTLQGLFNTGEIIPARIGLHAGEVLVRDGNVFGDAVNVASRVESMGMAGAVLLSSNIRNQIKNKPQFLLKPLGKFTFKNVREAMTIFALANGGLAIPDPNTVEGKFEKLSSEEKSLVVLPFMNRSSDPEDEYFSEGLTEDLIIALGKVKDLKVAGRTSSFAFKSKALNLQKIGKTLRVNHALEGSVRRQGNRLRVSATLVNIETGYQLWSERFDRQWKDIFDIQDEITLAILAQLKVHWIGTDKSQIVARQTENLEAYEWYLKGRYLWKQRGESLLKALEFFQHAIENDPQYALAWAGIADTYSIMAWYSNVPAREFMQKAKEAALRAWELAPYSAEAHTSLAFIYFAFDWDWEKAEHHFQQALILDSTYTVGFAYYSFFVENIKGEFEKGDYLSSKAVELDPMDPAALYYHCINLCFLEKYEEAYDWAKKLIEIFPDQFNGYRYKGWSLMAMKRYQEALEAYKMAAKLSDRHHWTLCEMSYAYACLGRTKEAITLLEELERLKSRQPITGHFLSLAYFYLGREDEAFESLEYAFQNREGLLLMVKHWPIGFPPMRKDSRYKALIKKIGFPEN